MTTKIMTPEFRVSYPNVFKPSAFEGSEPKYNLTMLIDKGEDLTKLKAAIEEAIEEAIKNKWKVRPKNLRLPLRDGDEEKSDKEEYANCFFVKAANKFKPGLVDQNLTEIIAEEDFYPGCYARATVIPYAYDVAGNKGVALSLQNIQKTRDGESFTGRTKAENDFDAVASRVGSDDPANYESMIG